MFPDGKEYRVRIKKDFQGHSQRSVKKDKTLNLYSNSVGRGFK